MRMLKEMIRGQRAETRTREIQNLVLRRKVRVEPDESPTKPHLKLPPVVAT